MIDPFHFQISMFGRPFLLVLMASSSNYAGVKWQTARKVHRCDECGKRIDPGTRYLHLVIFKGLHIATGIKYSGKLCPHCEAKFYSYAPRRVRQ